MLEFRVQFIFAVWRQKSQISPGANTADTQLSSEYVPLSDVIFIVFRSNDGIYMRNLTY